MKLTKTKRKEVKRLLLKCDCWDATWVLPIFGYNKLTQLFFYLAQCMNSQPHGWGPITISRLQLLLYKIGLVPYPVHKSIKFWFYRNNGEVSWIRLAHTPFVPLPIILFHHWWHRPSHVGERLEDAGVEFPLGRGETIQQAVSIKGEPQSWRGGMAAS